MKVEEMLKIVSEEIASMISTKTIIGEHITIEGRTIIPVTEITVGFGSGGGEGKNRDGNEGTGVGGGAGASVRPIAFLVISKEDVQLLTIKGKGVISQLTDVIPEIMEKYRSMKEEHKKEEFSETGKPQGTPGR